MSCTMSCTAPASTVVTLGACVRVPGDPGTAGGVQRLQSGGYRLHCQPCLRAKLSRSLRSGARLAARHSADLHCEDSSCLLVRSASQHAVRLDKAALVHQAPSLEWGNQSSAPGTPVQQAPPLGHVLVAAPDALWLRPQLHGSSMGAQEELSRPLLPHAFLHTAQAWASGG